MAQDIQYEWDEAKRRANLERHGVDFAMVAAFDWSDVFTADQTVRGERRRVTSGFIGVRLYVLIWTRRLGRTRVISLRKANKRERDAHEKATRSE